MSQCGAFFIGASTPDTARTGAGLYGGAIDMKGLAESIRMLGRLDGLVIDATGLTGKYRVKRWVAASTAPEVVVAPAASVPLDAAPMVLGALRDQLGLKLESTTIDGRVLVVDHIERPTEN